MKRGSGPNVAFDFYAETRARNEGAELHGLSLEEKQAYETVQYSLRMAPGRAEAEACTLTGTPPKLYFEAKSKAEASHALAFGERGFSHADLIRPGSRIAGGAPKARKSSPRRRVDRDHASAREGQLRRPQAPKTDPLDRDPTGAGERRPQSRKLGPLDRDPTGANPFSPSVRKTCTMCMTEKSAVDFYPYPSTADGLRNQCKACFTERVRKYKEKKRQASERSA